MGAPPGSFARPRKERSSFPRGLPRSDGLQIGPRPAKEGAATKSARPRAVEEPRAKARDGRRQAPRRGAPSGRGAGGVAQRRGRPGAAPTRWAGGGWARAFVARRRRVALNTASSSRLGRRPAARRRAPPRFPDALLVKKEALAVEEAEVRSQLGLEGLKCCRVRLMVGGLRVSPRCTSA